MHNNAGAPALWLLAVVTAPTIEHKRGLFAPGYRPGTSLAGRAFHRHLFTTWLMSAFPLLTVLLRVPPISPRSQRSRNLSKLHYIIHTTQTACITKVEAATSLLDPMIKR